MEQSFEIIRESIPGPEAANELMSRLFIVTRPESVYAQPVSQGEYMAITASEVSVGLGLGYGGGFKPEEAGEAAGPSGSTGSGFGRGGGGGGGAWARPVAVIEIGPQGMRVEPIIDPTKVILAFFTAFGSMFMMLARMRRKSGG